MSTDNNNALTILTDLNRGRVVEEFSKEFTELVCSVRKHGRGGSLTLVMKITPASGSNADRVIVAAAVSSKAPGATAYEGIYFTTENGKVQRNDPDQTEMQFRPLPEVAAPAPPVPLPAAQPAAS